jgi:signal peptidase I
MKLFDKFKKNQEEKKEPLYKKIIGYVVSMLCILLCLYITIEVVNANTNHRPPRIFGLSVSYVPTASMEPTIKTGDYIMFSQASFDSVSEGDIIVYYNANEVKYIVHRVIEKNEVTRVIKTKGDNNYLADDIEVTPDMIYGKYLTTLGFMAIFSGGINQNLIFFILIVIFALMLGMQIASIFINKKKEQLKDDKEKKKELLREEMKRQILAEELAKLKGEILESQKEKKESIEEPIDEASTIEDQETPDE